MYSIKTLFQKNQKSCNCVAFRLDAVQDYFLSFSQRAVIQKFDEKNVPLTIGVIGGLIGSDSDLITVINKELRDSTLEIASHSWNNSPITIYTKEKQEETIQNTNKVIFDIFGISPKVFIPPENEFDETTIDVLKANNFTHMSSSFNFDTPPFELTNSTFYRFPQVTQTAILDERSNLWVNENRTKIFSDIQSSMNNHGFAVVMMHPPDFSIYDKGIQINEVNHKQIEELSLLIDDILKAGFSIVPISQINLDSKPLEIPETLPTEELVEDSKPSCNCVAFRVDAVQDFWLNNVQIELLKTFEENNVDITVGIIGKFFGDDPLVISQLNSTTQKDTIQIKYANMGWEFIDHTQFGATEQASSIKRTSDKINEIFNTTPKMFIPPIGVYDSNTLIALEQNNIRYLSSNTKDTQNYAQKTTISYLPNTISGVDLFVDDPFLIGTISEKAILRIHSNLAQYGFSIISIQSTDFAKKQDQTFENEIDKEKIENFVNILAAIKENQIEIVTMDQIPEILWSKSLSIPEWIKNNAQWWFDNQINDSDFVSGIEYMIKEKIIEIPQLPESESKMDGVIPTWIRNNAGWWAQGQISDGDFVNGIEYLVKKGIIRV